MIPQAHREYVSWTPARLSRWTAQAGKQTQKVSETIMASKHQPQQSFRAVLGLIRMGQLYGQDRLEEACAKAIAIGSPSYKSIKSILKNQKDRY